MGTDRYTEEKCGKHRKLLIHIKFSICNYHNFKELIIKFIFIMLVFEYLFSRNGNDRTFKSDFYIRLN